ncbi:hypothetical protein [Legionella resiliens]|uniref:Terminase small subunit n=1 Tax=Legionella resiliens TaxID=2905958 RepID=A0ABS8X319_9GAMM|nr:MULTISPECIES: hypothetical protein [unclassified Legionella]MCE0723987.1 hypothetical protein [Legionella sp. 9fVS26]MCE3533140.1 hypothetical protein [Legionella sp. 8cVS16]
MGRPKIDYNPELAKEICYVVSCSSKGIKQLCKLNKHWPSHDTIYHWLTMKNEFSDLYARAKRHQIEVIIDEILDIADDTSNDIIINEDGRVTINHEHINRSKLRIDTRKWLAAKLCSRLYGNKDEHVNLKFPNDITDGSSLVKMSSEVFRALANEEISPEQARTLVVAIKDHGNNIVLSDLNERLSRLEDTANNQAIIEEK